MIDTLIKLSDKIMIIAGHILVTFVCVFLILLFIRGAFYLLAGA